jgi:glycosyltransferase involved in cell wall biosynthesis
MTYPVHQRNMQRASDSGVVRLTVQQPALPHYRLSVFRELAKRPEIALKVVYADNSMNVPTGEMEGLDAECTPSQKLRLGDLVLFWHESQWSYAGSSRSDVLVLCLDMHYLSLVPALLRARVAGVPTLLWGHGYSKIEARWCSLLRSVVTRLATALVFYNHGIARRYVDRGWEPERVHVALNSLDQAPIREAKRYWLENPEKLAEFRRERQIKHGDEFPTILFVSRLERANRLDMLLDAAAMLLDDYPQIQVVMIGSGEAEADLHAQSHALGLSGQVFFPGAIYNEMDLAPWFLSANFYCYPANIGLSLLHAFGYGLPVVTNDSLQQHGPEIEALRHEGNGLLYTFGNTRAMSEAVRRLIEDPLLTRRLSEGALRTVTEEYGLERMVDGMEQAVRYCAGKRRKGC